MNNSNNKSNLSQMNPSIEPKDTNKIKQLTGNVYESISVMAKRANQINVKTKEELQKKIREYSSYTDNLEEIHDNKELTEISRMYERMPNAAIRSTYELIEGNIFFKKDSE